MTCCPHALLETAVETCVGQYVLHLQLRNQKAHNSAEQASIAAILMQLLCADTNLITLISYAQMQQLGAHGSGC